MKTLYIAIFSTLAGTAVIIYLKLAREFTIKFGRVISSNKDLFNIDESCREIIITNSNSNELGLVIHRRVWLPYKLKFRHFLPSKPIKLHPAEEIY